MISLSEIDTTAKRATRASGFSWGISEEVGKNIKILEMYGLPGIKNLNHYLKIYKNHKFQNISLIGKINVSKIPYCPIITGTNFLDQVFIMDDLNDISFENLAFPILFIPFVSRASEIIGKKILLIIDDKKFLLNFNQSIYSNYLGNEIINVSKKVSIKFIENANLFSDIEWKELYRLSEDTFVDESDDLKQQSAGAGLTDND